VALECQTGEAGCASCHLDDGHAPYGLVLTGRDSLIATAIGRVAHQTETGGTTAVPLEAADRFGSGMPIIDPLRPDNSYLLYKLLVGPSVYGAHPGDGSSCSNYSVALPPGQSEQRCLEPPAEELARLRSWFVIGEPMPPARATDYLRRTELRELVEFIRAGAVCP
jgi:hypothetical protein